uniref:Uncharacterized protein n=1 Tax=Tetraselmis sp. GSL018 TaxID=582737 RepID=A0A061QSG5_9CHLO
MQSNGEWPGVELETFESPQISSSAQWQDNNYYFCSLTEQQSPVSNNNGWNVTNAQKVREEVLPDGSVKREFLLELAVDELSYSLILDDLEGTGYTGTLTIRYWDDKSSGRPYRFLYSNGVEVIVTKYVAQPVDLTKWTVPTCSDQRNVSRMSMAPYVPNYEKRISEIQCESPDNCHAWQVNPQVLYNATVEYDSYGMANSTRHLLYNSNQCSPRGSCYGNTRTTRRRFDLKAVSVTVEWWDGGCGLKELSFGTSCYYGVTCYGECEGELPWLCSSRNDFECNLGVRATFQDFIPWGWLRRAINSVGDLDAGARLEIGYSSYYDVAYADAIGYISLLHRGWFGSYGARVSLAGGVYWFLSYEYYEADVVAEGRACFGVCVSGQWTILNNGWYY